MGIDTGLVVVLTITIVMLLSVSILLFYDFEEWCPQVYSDLFNQSVRKQIGKGTENLRNFLCN